VTARWKHHRRAGEGFIGDSRQRQSIAFVHQQSGRQAQIETGKIVLREFPFDVEEIIGPLMSTLNFHAHKKGLLFTQYIEPDLPPKIVGDQFWLRQIVLNLVNNAVKFTEKGSVNVRFLRQGESHWQSRLQIPESGFRSRRRNGLLKHSSKFKARR